VWYQTGVNRIGNLQYAHDSFEDVLEKLREEIVGLEKADGVL